MKHLMIFLRAFIFLSSNKLVIDLKRFLEKMVRGTIPCLENYYTSFRNIEEVYLHLQERIAAEIHSIKKTRSEEQVKVPRTKHKPNHPCWHKSRDR